MRESRTTTIGVRVNGQEHELLEQLARANDLTVATAMRCEALRAARRLLGTSDAPKLVARRTPNS